MTDISRIAAENLELVRKKKPLVHNITNYVVMNFTANALLSMGASPVMAHALNEVEEMVALAGSLVLNIGTLSDDWVLSMITAGKKANQIGTPVILDPVGAGATRLRTDSAKKIIEDIKISVIRGNASEILSLRRDNSSTKGVDSLHSVDEAAETASYLAEELKTTLAVTGVVDLITDGKRVIRVLNGHKLMGSVTGTGCAATAITGAFLAVDKDPVTAAATALAYFGLAGEKAAIRANAPGSFMIGMLDALYEITPEVLEKESRFNP
ncbi:MAG: hydroxyethylthiazole kinase [Deltaproteobacteria bacterium]|nr:hydroxyethylthiazole kinase [Deltaproteobacteria bacterium]